MSGAAPDLSVLMSVRNNAGLLAAAVESILDQSYRDYELLITDDASTDEVPRLLARYAASDPRVRVITNRECRGLTASLNAMVREARGRLLARMDGDDISRPRRFEKQVEVFAQRQDVDVVFGDTCLIDPQGQPICRSWRPRSTATILKLLPYHNYIPHPTVMMKSSLFGEHGCYDERYRTGQDSDLWKRWARRGVRFYHLPEVLLDFRLNPHSVRRSSAAVPRWSAYDLAIVCVKNHDRRSAMRYLGRTAGAERARLLAMLAVPLPLHTARTLARRRLAGLRKGR